MKNNKKTNLVLLTIFLVVILSIGNVYAGMADFDDATADKQANEQLANQEKAEKENAGKSSNNYLTSLNVEGYTLSPEFDKQTLEYTINGEVEADSIKISAILDDERASVSGAGNVKIKSGENNLRIDVSAENGTVRTYFIKVTGKNQDKTTDTSLTDENTIEQNEISESRQNVEEQTNSSENNKNSKMAYFAIILLAIIIIFILCAKKKNSKH